MKSASGPGLLWLTYSVCVHSVFNVFMSSKKICWSEIHVNISYLWKELKANTHHLYFTGNENSSHEKNPVTVLFARVLFCPHCEEAHQAPFWVQMGWPRKWRTTLYWGAHVFWIHFELLLPTSQSPPTGHTSELPPETLLCRALVVISLGSIYLS